MHQVKFNFCETIYTLLLQDINPNFIPQTSPTIELAIIYKDILNFGRLLLRCQKKGENLDNINISYPTQTVIFQWSKW